MTLWTGYAKQTIFCCFCAKPNIGLSSRSRRDRKWARERRSERSWKKNAERQLAKGDAEGQSTPNSRRDQSAWDRVQKQWGKTSQDELAFLLALYRFRYKYTLAFVCRCTGNAVSQNHPSWTWVKPSPYCSFLVCSYSPAPSVVFLVAIKKCVIPLSEPLDESPAKTDCFEEVDVTGAPRGYCQTSHLHVARRHASFKHTTYTISAGLCWCTCVLFTLRNICTSFCFSASSVQPFYHVTHTIYEAFLLGHIRPVYFRQEVYFLLSYICSLRGISRRSSSQYLTLALGYVLGILPGLVYLWEAPGHLHNLHLS